MNHQPTAQAQSVPKATRGAPSGILQRQCSCGQHTVGGGECAACRRKAQMAQGLQRAALRSTSSTHAPPVVHEVLRSPGRPLEAATRTLFESRFGHDFGRVRIHADARAAQSARAVRAHAYTVGSHVVFGAGRYAPGTPRGRALLAHELTHVVQQRNGPAAEARARAGDAFEREAERNARHFATGRPLTFRPAPLSLARSDDERTTVTVQEPTGANDCRLEHHRAIAPAVRQSLTWLGTTVAALDAFLRAPADPGNRRVRASMERHFHSTSAGVARTLRDRLDLVRRDITRRGDPTNPDPARRATFTVECHDETDRLCQVANAYVRSYNTLVFCPIFFDRFNQEQRATSVIHEMAHALLGLRITDRAYSYDRLLPHLSTAEALDNAESYALFAREVGTGREFASTAPSDEIEACPARTEQLARLALARAERWNRQANTILRGSSGDDLLTTHLGDATPATRTSAAAKYHAMERRFRSSVRLVCGSQNCGTRTAFKRQAVDRRGAGAAIGAAVGGIVGAIGGGILGAVLGGVGGAVAGALLGGLIVGGVGALIGYGIGAAVSSEAAINLCPAWAAQADENDRIESILAAAYEVYGGLGAADSRNFAALARAIHGRYYPAPGP